jgi:hypothetical protein
MTAEELRSRGGIRARVAAFEEARGGGNRSDLDATIVDVKV